MQTKHPYSVKYTVSGIPYGNSFVFARNKHEALVYAKKNLEDDGLTYDEGSLKVEQEYRLYKSMK